MVWNYQKADCSLRQNFYCVIYYIFRHTFVTDCVNFKACTWPINCNWFNLFRSVQFMCCEQGLWLASEAKYQIQLRVPLRTLTSLHVTTQRSIQVEHGRPHIGANGVTPWKNGWKIKKQKHAKKSSFLCLCYILRAIRAGRCRERRYADH